MEEFCSVHLKIIFYNSESLKMTDYANAGYQNLKY